jgi:hypothetical protein
MTKNLRLGTLADLVEGGTGFLLKRGLEFPAVFEDLYGGAVGAARSRAGVGGTLRADLRGGVLAEGGLACNKGASFFEAGANSVCFRLARLASTILVRPSASGILASEVGASNCQVALNQTPPIVV